MIWLEISIIWNNSKIKTGLIKIMKINNRKLKLSLYIEIWMVLETNQETYKEKMKTYIGKITNQTRKTEH